MTFTRIAKPTLLLILLSLTVSTTVLARTTRNAAFNWGPLMDAITQVESEGDSRAVSGRSCGAMQITPILVEDCNAILKKAGSNKRYTLNDRYSVRKSREMFVLIMSHYNPDNDIERAIRLWNGGVRYTKRGTQQYYRKVMQVYK